MIPYTSNIGSRIAVFVLLLLLLPCAGCRHLGLKRPDPPTQTDRLMRAYPELRGGRRFVVIADFENPAHMELVQLISVSDRPRCVLDRTGGRAETGKACLRFTAGSPDDTIVISNSIAENWYLKRDWRDYDLLLMNIKSPRRSLRAEVEIAAGAPERRLAVHSSVALEKGWNAIRLDLAEVGERIPLDDVREMRLSMSGLDKPTDFYFDDLILTGNREDLFGDSRNTEGALYVQRAGRRWNVGAGGRFELTFANGQIVRWHNLAHDPYRVRNLVEGTTLGPSPMVIGASDTGESGFAELGKMVVARARITEMNPVRVVITCEWRFVDDVDAPLNNQPFQRWVYTIYPTGQVYVAVECTAKTNSWSASQLGLAVTLSSRTGDGLQTRTSSESAQPPTFATARTESTDSFLLYTLSEPHRFVPIRQQVADERRRVSLVATRPAKGLDVETWVCQLTLGPASEISDRQASARAIDYCEPGGLHLELGSFGAADRPTVGQNGFDQASGCYVIAPDGGQARFVIDGRVRPRFSPAFQIIDTEKLEAWIYVNHLIFDKVARDADGNLIFQLPKTIRDRTTVEVLLRRSQRLGGA